MIRTISIDSRYIEQERFDPSKLSFSGIFGKDFRKVVPLSNPKLSEIELLLSSGKTKSGGKYKVKIEDGTATKEGDNRIYNAGKVIGKELGQLYLDEWSRQVVSHRNKGNNVIVVSRHPIDVMRMSDHDGVRSCHSPDREYFQCALSEAKSGGVIGYVVKASDLEGVDLQSQEIFEDDDRGINGIVPLSRLRVNRYTLDNKGIDILVPGTRPYGKSVAGFYDSMKNWLHEVQPELKEEDIDRRFTNVSRHGGSYADYNDSHLFNAFFGSEHFLGNARYNREIEGEEGPDNEGMREIWQDEIDRILGSDEVRSLKNTGIYASAEISEDIVYVSAFFSIYFSFEDFDDSIFKKMNSFDIKDVFDKIFRREPERITEVEYQGGGDIRVNFDVDPENPDDLRNEISNFAWFEKNHYNRVKSEIYNWLVYNGSIESTPLHEKVMNEDLGLENLELDWDGEGEYSVYFELLIPHIPVELYIVSGLPEKLNEVIKKSVWDRLSQSYNGYFRQPSLFGDQEDLSISGQFPELNSRIFSGDNNHDKVSISWSFYVHDFTNRNQRVLMNFFKYLDDNFTKFESSIYNDMTAKMDSIMKKVPGPYYGMNWYERSKAIEERARIRAKELEKKKQENASELSNDSHV